MEGGREGGYFSLFAGYKSHSMADARSSSHKMINYNSTQMSAASLHSEAEARSRVESVCAVHQLFHYCTHKIAEEGISPLYQSLTA